MEAQVVGRKAWGEVDVVVASEYRRILVGQAPVW